MIDLKSDGVQRDRLLERAEDLLADLDLAGFKLPAAHMSQVVESLKEI